MKKLSKILISILASLVLIVSPFMLAGCGKDKALTDAQTNELFVGAAKNFYSNHATTENYSAITYHWNEVETTKVNAELTYKVNATDEETTTGVFESKTAVTTDTTIALKVEDEHFVAQIKVVTTTVETGNKVDAEDQTLAPYSDTTVETKDYRLFTYMDGETRTNILLFEKNKTVNGTAFPAATQKYYSEKTMADYDSFMEEYLLEKTNDNIENAFFSLAEMMIFYKNILSVEQNGNQVKFGFGYDIVQLGNNWEPCNVGVRANVYFQDGKILKATCNTAHVGENDSVEGVMNFDYTNSATISTEVPEDIAEAGYTLDNNIWSNSNNENCLTNILNNLPAPAIF